MGIEIELIEDYEKNALERAWSTRNYEINLYWKRAAYFWVFNTSLAVACYHFIITTSDSNNTFISIKMNIDYILWSFLLLGFACSIAWLLSNVASKRWQENWEHHINILEDKYEGLLYKTTLSSYKNQPKPSVSRLNLKISLLVVIAWLVTIFDINLNIALNVKIISLLVVLLFMLIPEFSLKSCFIELWTIAKLIFCKKNHNVAYMDTVHHSTENTQQQ